MAVRKRGVQRRAPNGARSLSGPQLVRLLRSARLVFNTFHYVNGVLQGDLGPTL